MLQKKRAFKKRDTYRDIRNQEGAIRNEKYFVNLFLHMTDIHPRFNTKTKLAQKLIYL